MLRENSKSLESTRTLWRKNMGWGRVLFRCYCYYFFNLPFFTFRTSFQFAIFFVLNFFPTISRRFISFSSSQRQVLQQQSDELRKNVSCKVTRFFVWSHIFTACLWSVFFKIIIIIESALWRAAERLRRWCEEMSEGAAQWLIQKCWREAQTADHCSESM